MHAYYQKCYGGIASCNCAGAVRIGKSVILVDKCGPKAGVTSPLSVQMFLNGDLEPGTQVVQLNDGHQFEVSTLHIKSAVNFVTERFSNLASGQALASIIVFKIHNNCNFQNFVPYSKRDFWILVIE